MVETKNIISIRGLRKSFKHAEVLKGIDLDIEAGSIFCLLGSNGAGKTTMVKILSTLLRFDSGEVSICGYDLVKKPEAVRRRISVTGQYAAVDALLTGRENMHMIGSLFHVDRVKDRTDALLALFDLIEAADRQTSTYSGGMRRKLDIAMSLLGDPQVLFLDEPTTGLDPQNRHAMWNEIKKLKERGITIFLTTQYLEEAEELADTVVILDAGKIVASGTVDELKRLLPGGMVELVFTEKEYRKALSLFRQDKLLNLHADNILMVMTDGSVTSLTDLLLYLKKNSVAVQSVKQKEPTLEDVFLTQINGNMGVY